MGETYISSSELAAVAKNSPGLYLRLPDLANENMEHPAKYQFQINWFFFFFSSKYVPSTAWSTYCI